MCSQSQPTETGNTEDSQLENPQSDEDEPGDSLVIERTEHEPDVGDKRSVLLAHKRNYVLPVTYAKNPNNGPCEIDGADRDELLDEFEVRHHRSIDPIPQSITQYLL
jgi:hypothetical protein